MDPLRRLLLLSLVASVILTEPSAVRALAADARHQPHDASAAVTQWVQRLAIAFRRTAQTVADSAKPALRKTDPLILVCVAQVRFVPAALTAHEFRPPPPIAA